MEANFDEMRRSATNNVNYLSERLSELMEDQRIDSDDAEYVINAFNDVAQSVGSFNCLYDPDTEGDMNDLSEKLNVKFLGEY